MATRKMSSAKLRTLSSRSRRSAQKVFLTCSTDCLPMSAWKSICSASSRDLRRVPMIAFTLSTLLCLIFYFADFLLWLQRAFEGGQFEGGQGGFVSLVAHLEAGAVDGLDRKGV